MPVTDVNEWTGEDITLGEVERELGRLRTADVNQDGEADLRTSVMTHLAWVPPEWEEAARKTLAGLEERYPSRTILLFPHACSREDGLDASVSLRCFPLGEGRHVCTEVIELRLSGRRTEAPASLASPLLIPDLPVFLRWRGRPPFASPEFEQLVDLADRLVVDSGEWGEPPYDELARVFDRIAVSDIAWARATQWRRALAGLWPGIHDGRELEVRGPRAEALLLVGWLRSRLDRDLELVHDEAEQLTAVAVDGIAADAESDERTASDLLSAELDKFTRDPVYEAAVRAAT